MKFGLNSDLKAEIIFSRLTVSIVGILREKSSKRNLKHCAPAGFPVFYFEAGTGPFLTAIFSVVTFLEEMFEYVRQKSICCLRIGLIYSDKDSVYVQRKKNPRTDFFGAPAKNRLCPLKFCAR